MRESKNFCTISHKVFLDLDLFLFCFLLSFFVVVFCLFVWLFLFVFFFFAVETWSSDDSHTHFISSDQCSREKTQLSGCLPKNLMLACFWTFTDQFVSNLVWWQTPLNCVVWYQFDWPWPSFKVTVARKQKLLHSFSHKFLSQFGWNLSTAMAYWFVQAHGNFWLHGW